MSETSSFPGRCAGGRERSKDFRKWYSEKVFSMTEGQGALWWEEAEEENFYYKIFPGGSAVKNPPANAGDPGSIPGVERSPGGRNGTHSSFLAWRIPWTEDPGGLQSVGLQSQTRLNGFHTHTRTHTQVLLLINVPCNSSIFKVLESFTVIK